MTASPKHKTHVGVIWFEYGISLGEIKGFHHFATLKFENVKANLQSCMSKGLWEYTFGPMEREESVGIRAPVLLFDSPPSKSVPSLEPAHLGLVTSMDIKLTGGGRPATPVDLCDALPLRYFEEMKRVPSPTVESLNINQVLY
jgi:hypothetical protein